jgi:hypothetical protein
MTDYLDTGIFTISIDFELVWGTLDSKRYRRLDRLCTIERYCVIDRLLALFAEYGISATWCTVGHLFLDNCSEPTCVDRALHGRNASEETAPLFLGRSLVERILRCPVPQEIGCHTFTHINFSEDKCSKAAAEAQVASCILAAHSLGIKMRSFVFPRNLTGHLDVLRAHGFACFRGPEPRWWNSQNTPGIVGRLGHLVDIGTASTPPVVQPVMNPSGLWNIPGSMLFTPAQGLRRAIPISFRVRRARKGLDAAAKQKKIFHLWFHPTDLAANCEPMLRGLRNVLEHGQRLRDRNELRILPMASLVPQRDLVAVA